MGERSCPRDDCGYSVARTMNLLGRPTPLPLECPNCGTTLIRHDLDE
jgi:ribosomal protein S27AE